MALSKEQTAAYIENLKEFKAYIEELKKDVSIYKFQMKKNTNKAMDPYYQLALVLNSIKLINTCIGINEVSLLTRNLKAEDYLNTARKEIYSVLSAMEKVVEINPLQRLHFLKSFRKTINTLVDAYGQGSKWRWSWPEIYFKLAVLTKNFFDFRAFERENDLDNPYFYVRKEHYNLIIELANYTAQEYRTKFDLSTNDTGDLKKSVAMLEMNRKIFQITGNTDDLDKTKTLIESLNNKIDTIENDKTNPKKKKK